MFTTQKIEADKWPWATLAIPERVDQATWIEGQETVPTLRMWNGIGSSHDIRLHFKDTYVDLCMDVQHGAELSENCDGLGGYLI